MANKPRRSNGEGTTYKRTDGRWESKVDLGWRDGRRVRRSVYGRTEKESAKKKREMQANLDRGIAPGDRRVTVAAWLRRWLAQSQADWAVKTVENYSWVIESHLVPGLGAKRLIDLTPGDVQMFLRTKAEAGYSASSRMRMRAVLRQALRSAEVEGLIARNVAALVDVPRLNSGSSSRALTADQAKALLAAAEGDRKSVV